MLVVAEHAPQPGRPSAGQRVLHGDRPPQANNILGPVGPGDPPPALLRRPLLLEPTSLPPNPLSNAHLSLLSRDAKLRLTEGILDLRDIEGGVRE